MKRDELKRDLERLQQDMERIENGLIRAMLCANYYLKLKELPKYGVPLDERLSYHHWLVDYMNDKGVGKEPMVNNARYRNGI